MGFLHVGQAGLKLQTSGDPPALASQSAAITGMSHCAQTLLVLDVLNSFLWPITCKIIFDTLHLQEVLNFYVAL